MSILNLRLFAGRSLRFVARRIEPTASVQKLLPYVEDDYLNWLRFAVPGMLVEGNVEAMFVAIRDMPAHTATVEIGSFCGLSAAIMVHFLNRRENVGNFFTCDKWEFEGQQLGQYLGESTLVTHEAYRDYVRSSFIRNMETFCGHKKPHTIECFSDEFFSHWNSGRPQQDVFGRHVTLGGDIGFSFIDGNHTYDFARRDFENTHHSLVSGGFILFDDSGDGSGWEVNQLVREIKRGGDYELIMRNPNYLFRKK